MTSTAALVGDVDLWVGVWKREKIIITLRVRSNSSSECRRFQVTTWLKRISWLISLIMFTDFISAHTLTDGLRNASDPLKVSHCNKLKKDSCWILLLSEACWFLCSLLGLPGPFSVTEPVLNYTWEQRAAAPLPHLCFHPSSLWKEVCEAIQKTSKTLCLRCFSSSFYSPDSSCNLSTLDGLILNLAAFYATPADITHLLLRINIMNTMDALKTVIYKDDFFVMTKCYAVFRIGVLNRPCIFKNLNTFMIEVLHR